MVITGGLLAIFAGWIWGAKNAADELAQWSKFVALRPVWIGIIKYLAPLAVLIIFLGVFIT